MRAATSGSGPATRWRARPTQREARRATAARRTSPTSTRRIRSTTISTSPVTARSRACRAARLRCRRRRIRQQCLRHGGGSGGRARRFQGWRGGQSGSTSSRRTRPRRFPPGARSHRGPAGRGRLGAAGGTDGDSDRDGNLDAFKDTSVGAGVALNVVNATNAARPSATTRRSALPPRRERHRHDGCAPQRRRDKRLESSRARPPAGTRKRLESQVR